MFQKLLYAAAYDVSDVSNSRAQQIYTYALTKCRKILIFLAH